MTLPVRSDMSWKRCPKSSCPDYAKRLMLEVGQHETEGDLTVEHRCPTCGYCERGPRTPIAARRTSAVAERIRQHRMDGWVIPLVKDTTPWPEEIDA